MNYNEIEKAALKTELQNLVKSVDVNTAEDCYCALMKQIFLSKSSLN